MRSPIIKSAMPPAILNESMVIEYILNSHRPVNAKKKSTTKATRLVRNATRFCSRAFMPFVSERKMPMVESGLMMTSTATSEVRK